MTRVLASVALAALLLTMLAGCAHQGRYTRGVPIDARPTPRQPSTEATAPAPAAESPSQNGESNAKARQTLVARIVADTTAASAAARRCATRTLLPDQESVFDTVRSLLLQTHSAMATGEYTRAESLARKARSLAASLSCP